MKYGRPLSRLNKIIQRWCSVFSWQCRTGHFYHLSWLKAGTPAAQSLAFSFVFRSMYYLWQCSRISNYNNNKRKHWNPKWDIVNSFRVVFLNTHKDESSNLSVACKLLCHATCIFIMILLNAIFLILSKRTKWTTFWTIQKLGCLAQLHKNASLCGLIVVMCC